MEDAWNLVDRLRVWLDDNAVQGKVSNLTLLQVLKIAEEFGGVAEAIHGATGANPRKGASHTWEDVHTGLCDVIASTTLTLKVCAFDEENAAQTEPNAMPLMRVLKIAEEFGEVAEAISGATGMSPRTGATWDDVRTELCDLIVTAMLALKTLTPDAEKLLDERLDYLVKRVVPG
ncbi:MazG-like family protein [Streptomyces hygroscopicus]|uniref:MazG-like family protein n=1 Tax=Streptomyces hygroscopicus TaxID=1912 RepID=UPI0036BE6F7A